MNAGPILLTLRLSCASPSFKFHFVCINYLLIINLLVKWKHEPWKFRTMMGPVYAKVNQLPRAEDCVDR